MKAIKTTHGDQNNTAIFPYHLIPVDVVDHVIFTYFAKTDFLNLKRLNNKYYQFISHLPKHTFFIQQKVFRNYLGTTRYDITNKTGDINPEIQKIYAKQYLEMLWRIADYYPLYCEGIIYTNTEEPLLKIGQKISHVTQQNDTNISYVSISMNIKGDEKSTITFVWINWIDYTTCNLELFLNYLKNQFQKSEKIKVILAEKWKEKYFFWTQQKETVEEIKQFYLASENKTIVVTDCSGNTLLHYVCKKYDKALFEKFIDKVDKTVFNADKELFFQNALFMGSQKNIPMDKTTHYDFVKYLLEKNFDPFNHKLQNGNTMVTEALRLKRPLFFTLYETFLSKINGDIKNNQEKPLAHLICDNADWLSFDTMQNLNQKIPFLFYGPDNRGNLPLHQLCRNDFFGKLDNQLEQLVTMYFPLKKNPTLSDKDTKLTPFNEETKNKDGETPYDVATPKMKKILEEIFPKTNTNSN